MSSNLRGSAFNPIGLRLLVPSAPRFGQPPAEASPVGAICAGCGAFAGRFGRLVADGAGGALPACPLCLLPVALDRPDIDEEAAVVWLPEMSQAALCMLFRCMHLHLHARREKLAADEQFVEDCPLRRAIHTARVSIAARTVDAVSRIGTASPRELGIALSRLPPAAPARLRQLVSGLRLLPLGRFFEGGRDVYPDVVAGWAGSA